VEFVLHFLHKAPIIAGKKNSVIPIIQTDKKAFI